MKCSEPYVTERSKKFLHNRTLRTFDIALLTSVIGTAHSEKILTYKVTIANITHGEFANDGDRCRTGPIIGLFSFSTHRQDFKLFELGKPVRQR